jgi:molybdopterin-guanine dinucleotide biosynthesis protein A
VVLVGENGAYTSLGLDALADARPNAGPLGGLVSLLERAGDGAAIAVACDMPFLTAPLFARLASHAPSAAAVAPRDGDAWSPLFARYDASRVLAEAKRRLASESHALQPLLDAVGAEPLPLAPDEARALRDWDSPADIEPAES